MSASARAAFTLLEILVVIAIIAVLVGITLTVGQSVQERSRVARARAELAVLAAALDSYKAHYGDYPRTSSAGNDAKVQANILFEALCGNLGPVPADGGSGTDAMRLPSKGRTFVELARFTVENPAGLPDPAEPTAVVNAFVDPWGRPYGYLYRSDTSAPWDHPSFVLWSVGSDGADEVRLNLGPGGLPAVPAGSDDLLAGR